MSGPLCLLANRPPPCETLSGANWTARFPETLSTGTNPEASGPSTLPTPLPDEPMRPVPPTCLAP